MKIMICGSMAFIQDIVTVKKQLDSLGHTSLIPHGTEPHLIDNKFVEKLRDNLEYCIKNNIMKKNFDMVAESDAILVLNTIPHFDKHRWVQEVRIMQPIFLSGDLTKIN